MGEGIFIAFSEDRVSEWEKIEDVIKWSNKLDRAWSQVWHERSKIGDQPPYRISPRRLLVHSFSHALMNELSATCGYGAASLRERLYISEPDSSEVRMAGVLIYTASSDADGTLGGLEREGRSQRLTQTVRSAVGALRWCSSDPLCISGINTISDLLNGAACHSCLFASETSCEMFNQHLDRAVVVGALEETADQAVRSYFDDFLNF